MNVKSESFSVQFSITTFQPFRDLLVCKQTKAVRTLERSVKRKTQPLPTEGVYLSQVACNSDIMVFWTKLA